MNRKMIGTFLAVSLAFSAGIQAQAGDYAYGFSPRTGDSLVDNQLGDINRYARGNSDSFIEDVVASFGVPRSLVRDYYVDRRWAPGDIYFACALARQLGRPCVEILNVYERDHGQGWGVIAQRLGIKPGSPAFHSLKGRVGNGHGKLKGQGPRDHGSEAGRPPQATGAGRPPQATGQGKGKGKGKDD